MNLERRKKAFIQLGEKLSNLTDSELDQWYFQATAFNNWFTRENVIHAVKAIASQLTSEKIEAWLTPYNLEDKATKNVAVVMAGNIPLVGFHDYLTVLIAGHNLQAKISSQDPYLIKGITELLTTIEPEFNDKIKLTQETLSNFDAVIATGSNNSARYFEQYFSRYPHIIRKNRTSIAVLTGDESEEEIQALGKDMFQYYGLGCRNVSKLYVPEQYDFQPFLDSLQSFKHLNDHHKWVNNYDYNKSIYLVNGEDHFDSGFFLMRESEEIVSPISVVYFEYYKNESELSRKIQSHRSSIQCKVGKNQEVNFGEAQQPELWDYADGVDTLKFLSEEIND